MDERVRFVLEQARGLQTMTELCEIYDIARQTGYYWLRRYRQGGLEALHDRDRAPRRHPNQTAAKVEEAVLELRRAHMSWGPRKLKRVLERERPQRPVAGDQHHRRAAGARRIGGGAQEAATRAALHRTFCRSRCAESSVVRRLQRLVSNRGRRAHRSADHHRCLQPLFAALPGGGEDGLHASASDFRIGLSRMRPAGRDSHR